jgi:hypothetical protein
MMLSRKLGKDGKMNNRLSEKDQKTLLNALEKAREKAHQMRMAEEEKRWSEIKVPLSLGAALAGMTKDDLSLIRRNVGMTGASALKKSDLIAALEQHIPAGLPETLGRFDETRFKIFKQIVDHGGQSYIQLEFHQLAYFKDRGLIFSGMHKGKRTMVLPQEILESFKSIDSSTLRETVRRNTEWIKLTQGMLFYYGSLGINALQGLMKSHGVPLILKDYLNVLEDSIPFHQEMKFDRQGLSNSRVQDTEKVIEEHQFRADLPYYPFTTSQLLLAGAPEFVDRNPSHHAFVNFIRKYYGISREEADFIVEDCADDIRLEKSPGHILQSLQQQIEMDDLEMVKSFMDHIVLLHNHTRQWSLKGHTPNELSAAAGKTSILFPAPKADVISIRTGSKVGRNDPCPCGSGKKFKKCCG